MTGDLATIEAWVRLASLDGMGPRRLRAITDGADPIRAVDALRLGRLPAGVAPAADDGRRLVGAELLRQWAGALAVAPDMDLGRIAEPPRFLWSPDDPRWPFADDPDPPAILFGSGDRGLVSGPTVAIVGTRRCTSVGRRVAFDLGRDLAAAGIAVVSGLATGIDGAAHRGVLEAGGAAIGVVASGLDVPYPASNAALWERIAAEGLLLTESGPGVEPARWRFPARNRLIAALADLVIVVESHASGGALITVDEAAERGVDVAAVPGAVTSAASAGTNQLIADGAVVVRSADDVVGHLGSWTTPDHEASPSVAPVLGRPERVTAIAPQMQRLTELVAGGPVSFDDLVEELGIDLDELLALVDEVAATGGVTVRGHRVGPGDEPVERADDTVLRGGADTSSGSAP